jgi:hypothetical protein
MARPKRLPDEQGRLQCTKCGERKHISDFYQSRGAYCTTPNLEGEMTWYGKPLSWCKDCVKKHQQEQRDADLARAQRLESEVPDPAGPTDAELALLRTPAREPVEPEEPLYPTFKPGETDE